MGRAMLIIITTVLMLMAGCIVHAAPNGDRRYEIRMDYGSSMTGVGETEAGKTCYFIWRFGEGRKSVSYLGTNPKVDPTTFWPSVDDDADDLYDGGADWSYGNQRQREFCYRGGNA